MRLELIMIVGLAELLYGAFKRERFNLGSGSP